MERKTVPATLLLWNNLVNVLLVAVAIFIFNQFLDISRSPALGIVLEILSIVFIVLLFGEIMPKLYAQSHPLKVLTGSSPIVNFLDRLTSPLSSLFVKATKATQVSPKKRNSDVSVDELTKALELTSEELHEEKDMLEGIIGLYNKTAAEIMTSRMDISDLSVSVSFKEVIDFIVETVYSRIPVYGESQDDIKGVLYIKDLLPYLKQPDDFHWQKLIRPAFFVPETKKIDDLLEEFRANKIHLAVVIDEFGGTSGIVTMEDILEEIVGDISDEYDEDEEQKCVSQDDGTYVCDAKILLTDFFRAVDIDPKEFGKLTDEVDTLAGLVLEIKEDFPEEGETVLYGRYSFHVLEMDDKRISKIRFSIDRNEDEKED